MLDVFAIASSAWPRVLELPERAAAGDPVVFLIGVIVVGVLAVGLLTMRNFGRRILNALPTPHRILDLYNRFEEGVFGAAAPRGLPVPSS